MQQASPRVLAVDGNSLGHRGFHSTRSDPHAGPHATTGAVISMLAAVWSHGPYDGVVVAFDHPVNQRRLDYPEYKANREAAVPALRDALQALRTHLGECGFTVIERHGAEADDLIAAAVDDCSARGWSCDIVSSDRDMIALVADNVRLLRPQARFADLTVEDRDRVRSTYGIEPDRYTELAALRGDPSDGLAGVGGVGVKTAARLLRDHGSVEGIYASLNALPPRLEASFRGARERIERNLVLMAPIPHLTVDVSVSIDSIDLDRVEHVLAMLDEAAAARRLQRAINDPRPPMPPQAPPPPDVELASIAATRPAKRNEGTHDASSGLPPVERSAVQVPLF